ncbi:MAG: Coenzyme F420 hydrogenase/dehydrogenase, beta subunit C-terminal domain, partial [Nitrososphaerota archaeon]
GRMHISLKNGTTLDIPLKEARIYARSACRFCDDFSSELADLSLGGVGLDGWTLTIIRTEQGQRFYDMALTCGAIEAKPIDECHSALELLRRLSLLKKKNAQKRNC